MADYETDVSRAARTILATLPVLGRAVASRMRGIHEGASPGHYALLHALAVEPLPLGELAERMQVSAPTMSVTVHTLVSRGWLRSERSSKDRRIVMIHATEAGVQVLEAMRHEAKVFMQELLSPLPPDELTRVCDGIEILRGLLVGPSGSAGDRMAATCHTE